MFSRKTHSNAVDVRQQRRSAVKACLARHGLGSGPKLLPHGPQSEGVLERLTAALLELGPPFVSFGHYLTSRYDLFPAADCLQMDKAFPVGKDLNLPPQLQELNHPQLKPGDWHELAQSEAVSWRRFLQTTSDQDQFMLCVPSVDVHEEMDGELLGLIVPALNKIWPAQNLEHLVADFQADLGLERDALAWQNWIAGAASYNETASDDDFVMPVRVEGTPEHLRLSRHPRAMSLTLVLARPDDLANQGIDQKQLARKLCLAFLRAALMGAWFPAYAQPAHLAALEEGRLLFHGGALAKLDKPTQAQLSSYLMSVVAGNPDDAFAHLLPLLSPGPGSDAEALKHRFRQAVPFRDGGWGQRDMADSLSEQLFLQWRIASEHGFAPQGELRQFFRGLAAISHLTRRLVPSGDVLREALYGFRLKSGMEEMRKAFGFQGMSEEAEAMFGLMSDLPRKLEHALRERAAPPPASSPVRTASTSSAVFSLSLVMFSLVWVTRTLSATWPWVEGLNTILFLVLGGLLLRVLIR